MSMLSTCRGRRPKVVAAARPNGCCRPQRFAVANAAAGAEIDNIPTLRVYASDHRLRAPQCLHKQSVAERLYCSGGRGCRIIITTAAAC